MPLTPLVMTPAKKKGSFLGLLFNIIILAGLAMFIWWFYQAMKKNAAVPAQAPPAQQVAAVPAPPPVEQVPEGAGAPEGVPAAEVPTTP